MIEQYATVDPHYRWTLSAGHGLSLGPTNFSMGRVITVPGRRGFSLPSLNPLPTGFSAVAFPTGVAIFHSYQLAFPSFQPSYFIKFIGLDCNSYVYETD